MANPKRQVSVFLNGKEVETSAKSLTNAFRQASNELAKMVIGSDQYLSKLEEVTKINGALQEHRQNLKGVQEGYSLTKAGLDKLVGVAAGAFAVEQVFAYGRELFNTAGQMELLSKKAATVFGESLPQITAEAQRNAEAMGLTTAEYIANAASIQDLLVPMGFQRKEAANISAQLVNLSGALSEWSGGQRSANEVSEILSSALLGERDALKGLGISLQQADIDAEIAARGLKSLTGESKKQAEAAVTLDLIMQRSVDAQTAFASGAGSLVRQQAELTAQVKDLAQRMAEALLPVFQRLVGVVADAAGAVFDFIDPAKAASKEFDNQAHKVNNLEQNMVPLLDRYDTLSTKTNLSKKEQGELKGIIEKVSAVVPLAVTEFDKYGNALGLKTDKAREFIETEKARLKVINSDAIEKYTENLKRAQHEAEILQNTLNSGKGVREFGVLRQLSNEELQKSQSNLQKINEQITGINAEIARLSGGNLNVPKTPVTTTTTTQTGSGGGGVDKETKKLTEKEKLTAEIEANIIAHAKERADTLINLSNLVTNVTDANRAKFLELQQLEFDTLANTNQAKLDSSLHFEEEKAVAEETIRTALLTDRQAEIEALQLHYQQLLQLADSYGIDRKGLEENLRKKLAEVNDKYDKETAQKQYDANQERLKVLGDSFTALGNVVAAAGDLFANEAGRSSKLSKIFTLAKIAFDTASAISSLVAASSANPANSTTFGAAGIIQYAVGIVRILANIAQAKKILSSAPAVPQKFEGSYLDVTGAQDGRQYRARGIGAPGTGLLPSYPVLFTSNATGAPVLASERGAEYFVSSDDLRNPAVANHVRMIENITRGGSAAQFADGGLNAAPAGAAGPTVSAMDTAIIERNTAVLGALLNALNRGIIAIVPDGTITDINKRFKVINDASGGFFS